MMKEVLERRFTRALKEREEDPTESSWPDLVLIDGGAGQHDEVGDVAALER